MNVKFRLIVLSFLQFFVWGAWLISLGGYMIVTLKFTGIQVGLVYGTMGISALFMPALLGIVADRWINAERLLGACHLIGACLLLWASTITDYDTLYLVMLLNTMVYMPTIALANTVSYTILEKKGFDIVKTFPPIRVWGTVGFIAAMWMVDMCGWTLNAFQLYISAGAALLLGIYAFTMPPCPPAKVNEKKGLVSML
ncbi:MAG: MFS transporter, partial [Saprospiraceae bacterium]|nr:MFS transporter [Saprospiraceae bacterium]